MRFSVVIPTCRRFGMLRACLEHLSSERQRFSAQEYEVIVTDDCAGEPAEAVLSADFPWVHWTKGPSSGPAANRNHGASLAKGDWIVFVDDDCLPGANWLDAYKRATQLHSDISVLEGRTLPFGERHAIDMDAPINTHGGFLWSCNFAIRRQLFDALGGFDEMFDAATMEDVELAVRLRAQGSKWMFVPDAVVFHPWRRRKGRSQLRAYARSVAHFSRKHPGEARRFSISRSARNMIAAILRQTREGVAKYRGRGVLRCVGLEIYMFVVVAIAMRARVGRRT